MEPQTSEHRFLNANEEAEIAAMLFPKGSPEDPEHQKILFEQYKLLHQSAEQLSARRQTVNGFFLSINSFMLAGIGFTFKESFDLFIHEHRVLHLMLLVAAISMIGLAVDINWSRLLGSYGKVLYGQIRVMAAMEKHLPAAVLTAQTHFYPKDFHSLTSLEKSVAHTFQIIYALSAIGACALVMFRQFNP